MHSILPPVSEAWLIWCRIWNTLWLSCTLTLPAVFPACGTFSCSHKALLLRVRNRVWYRPNRSSYSSDWPRSNHCTEGGQRTQSGSIDVPSAPTVSSFSGPPARWKAELKDTVCSLSHKTHETCNCNYISIHMTIKKRRLKPLHKCMWIWSRCNTYDLAMCLILSSDRWFQVLDV